MHLRSVSVTLIFLAACGDQEHVNRYISDLPTWSEFSPARTAPAEPVGEPQSFTSVGELTEITEQPDGSAVTNVYEDVEYDCTTTDYSMTDTPTQFVSYSPDAELLYPGALVQGRSHRDGVAIGSILPLPITDRTPTRVSIPSIPSGENFREVEEPNQAVVAGAIGEMVGNATVADLPTPSTIDFHLAQYHSEAEYALSMGLSGRYFGFRASADVDTNREQTTTTVTAHYFEKMFEVVVEPPSTPGAFFSDAFNEEKLQEQEDLGRIGPDNLPIYVSNVVYGRMLTYSVTSTAQTEQVTAALEATFRKLGQGASTEISAEHKAVLQTAEISVKTLGGNADNVLDLIQSGDLRAYFDEAAPLSTAAPLSYTFRNLGDGSIASVAETTTYSVTECEGEAAPTGPVDPDERVMWLDRMVLHDDACDVDDQGKPNRDVELTFLFSVEQQGVREEIVDQRDSQIKLRVDGIYEFDRVPVQYADADGVFTNATIYGDAWEQSASGERHFEPINDEDNTWDLTFSGSTEIGETCHRRYVGSPQGACEVQLYLCVVNGNVDSYDEADCVNPDPDRCL